MNPELRRALYKTIEDSITTLDAPQVKLVEFTGPFSADVYVSGVIGSDSFELNLSVDSNGSYVITHLVNDTIATLQFEATSTSVFLVSDTNINSINTRTEIKYGVISDPSISVSTDTLTNLVDIDGASNVQFKEVLATDGIVSRGTINVNDNLDINADGELTTSGLVSADGGINVNDALTVNNLGQVSTTGVINANGGIAVDTDKFTVSNTGSITTSALSNLNDGIAVDTNKFTVDATGNVKFNSLETTASGRAITNNVRIEVVTADQDSKSIEIDEANNEGDIFGYEASGEIIPTAEYTNVTIEEPQAPLEGDLWFSTADKTLFSYDGTAEEWVAVQGYDNVSSISFPHQTLRTPDIRLEEGGTFLVTGTSAYDKVLLNGTGKVFRVVDGTAGEVVSIDNPTGNIITSGTITAPSFVGNASSATKLNTSRNINGVAFDGSQNITVPVNTTQKTDNVGYNIPFVASTTAGNQDIFTDSESSLTFNPSTNTLSVSGNLIVNGETTSLDTSTLQVEDKNIELGKVETPTDATAEGGGITLLGATNKTITWGSTNGWSFNDKILSSGTITGSDLVVKGTQYKGTISLGGSLDGDRTYTLPNATGTLALTDDIVTYSNFGGASESQNGTAGLVPQPLIADREKFLRGDGEWTEVTAEGTEVSVATETVLGTVRLFSNTQQSVGANAVTTASSRTYGIQFNGSNQLVVNVPWTDTNDNTTYSAGTGLSLSGTAFNHLNSITAGSVGPNSNATLIFSGTFTVPQVTYDAQGHISGVATRTFTMPAEPTGGGGSGDVVGPASSVNGRIATFNGTTGKLIQDSGFTIATSVPADAVFTDTNTVTKLRANTSSYLTGDISLLAGTNVSLSQSGSNITISSTASGGGDTDISISRTGSTVTVQSSTGNNGDITGATTSLAGVVTTGAQTFVGTKTFNSGIEVQSGLDISSEGGNITLNVDQDGFLSVSGAGLEIKKLSTTNRSTIGNAFVNGRTLAIISRNQGSTDFDWYAQIATVYFPNTSFANIVYLDNLGNSSVQTSTSITWDIYYI